MICPQC
jgi:hypothetical protein